MTAAARATIKALFETGDTLLEASFIDLIDSYASLLDENAKTFSSGGTDDYSLFVSGTLNDSGAAGGSDVYRALKLDITETDVTGWDNVYVIDCMVGGTSVFRVADNGATEIITGDVVGLTIQGASGASATSYLQEWLPDGVSTGDAAHITAAGEFSNNGGGSSGSEMFGKDASVHTGANTAIAVGNGASVGNGAHNSIAFGRLADVGNFHDKSVVVGNQAATGGSNSIALGHNATTTAQAQFVVGDDDSNSRITDMYLGGVNNGGSGYTVTFHAPNGAGTDNAGSDVGLKGGDGSATNSDGGDVNIYGGLGAGSGNDGNVNLCYTGVGTDSPQGSVVSYADINPNADGTLDLGTSTTAQWANVWADLVNGAEIGLENNYRIMEGELYGYVGGFAIGTSDKWEKGKSIWHAEESKKKEYMDGQSPLFAATEDFLEYKGRRITSDMLDKLLALIGE